MPPTSHAATQLLIDWSNGDETALEKLQAFVYEELHKKARALMRRERQGHPLQATELINQAFVRIIRSKSVSWQNRAHFIAIATRIMRRILIEYACEHKSGSGAWQRVSVSDAHGRPIEGSESEKLIALHQGLQKLAAKYPRQALVAELRLFGQMTDEDIAESLDIMPYQEISTQMESRGIKIKPAQVQRDWVFAQAFLKDLLSSKERQ